MIKIKTMTALNNAPVKIGAVTGAALGAWYGIKSKKNILLSSLSFCILGAVIGIASNQVVNMVKKQ